MAVLTLQFIPYSEIEQLGSARRIKKLLDTVKEGKIILLQGRLKKSEETGLITQTMNEVDEVFKGIELSVIYPDKSYTHFFNMVKKALINLIMGDRQGFTIIGPATIIKEIKKDPDKIQLLTEEVSTGKRSIKLKNKSQKITPSKSKHQEVKPTEKLNKNSEVNLT